MFITGQIRKTAVILATLTGLALAALAPQVRASIAGASPRAVSLYLTVEDDGNLIGGLTAENFRLLEQEKSRLFRLEQPDGPAAIALLVEHSQSSWLYKNDIFRAVQGFISAAPPGNWYALATFSHELNVEVDFTRQKGKLASAYAGLGSPMRDEVNTYDAIYQMLETLDRLPGRRVLIVIGSGLDSFSGHTLDEVQKRAESVNVLIYGIGAGSMLRGYYAPYLGSFARLDLLRAEAFFNMLAGKSGGQAWFPRFEAAFPDVMEGVMQMLDHQYKLVYNSRLPADGKFYEIEVEAFRVQDDKRQDYEVRVREGWRFEKTGSRLHASVLGN
ncbi:MAG: VWA domain-containing protein [Acidobacteria bacterium]|nr:VWA domain-containing protein [Acidobacteriota bacterium]